MGGDGDLTGTQMRRREVTALGDVSSQSQDSEDGVSPRCAANTKAGSQCRKKSVESSIEFRYLVLLTSSSVCLLLHVGIKKV